MLDLDFGGSEQARDWVALMAAIKDAPDETPCINFPDAFFPNVGDSGVETQWAKTMCFKCPVRAQCAEYGIKHEDFGIWGGIVPRERRKLRRHVA